MNEIDLSRLTIPELVDLLHRAADEIQLRAMEQAGEQVEKEEIAYVHR